MSLGSTDTGSSQSTPPSSPSGVSNRVLHKAAPFVLPIIGLVGGLAAAGTSPSAPPTDLTFLAVGQGDCTVFRHQGLTVLIDVGPKSDRSDAGSRIIVPALRKLRVRQVDLVLISHPDSDHIGGLAAIAKRFRIGNVGAPASFKSHPEMLGALESAGIDPKKVLWIKEPTAIKWGNFRLHIDSMPWIPGASDNDGSMCVQVTDGRASATFSGDASEFAEEQLLPRWNWQGDILHVGHHGSASSSSFGWLREVHPKYAVISCGRMNPYGHPARAALDRLGQLKIPVLRTDLNGNITFKLGPNEFEPEINP